MQTLLSVTHFLMPAPSSQNLKLNISVSGGFENKKRCVHLRVWQKLGGEEWSIFTKTMPNRVNATNSLEK